MTVKVTNYGASLTFVSAPDKEGVFAPVVLGLDSLRYYLGRQPKLGATVGRYANRIRNAELVLNDRVYYLDKNNNPLAELSQCILDSSNGSIINVI